MKALVIGLGSMGKRRVRNLIALGNIDVFGFDTREDRAIEASKKYGITVFDSAEVSFNEVKPDIVVLSVPPKLHMHYANQCLEKMIPCFIEASVTDRLEIEKLAKSAREKGLVIAPSCTMRFYPGPQKIKSLLAGGMIGKPLSVNYQTGQYLPDWHPWEPIQEFYVSERETGGAREIVPFELTWINDLLGVPKRVLACAATKLTDMDADIDDIYHCMLQFPEDVILNMTVEVVSRPISTREMLIIGSKGKIKFSADSNSVSYCNLESDSWIETTFETGTVEAEYINPEEPYINEMKSFVDAAVSGKQADYPNSLADDVLILKTLEDLEEINSLAN
ncbi:MAG: Gfo/Idh/MocA family oxidoreductase [Colwellia sp.]